MRSNISLYVTWIGDMAYRHAAKIARELRSTGFVVELAADDIRLKKALETASKLQVQHVLIIGEQEIAAGRYQLRDMITGKQMDVTKQELFDLCAERMRVSQ